MHKDLNTLPSSIAQPWGGWATTGMGLFIILSFFIVPMFVATVLGGILVATRAQVDPHLFVQIETNGLFICISGLLTALLGGLLVFVAIRMRQHTRPQLTFRKYLHLHPVKWRRLFLWIGILVFFLTCMDGISYWLERPLVPDVMVKAYATAGVVPLFWLTLVLVAPIFEEVLFRGFLLEGYRRSMAATIIAIVIISALWAVIHLQYGWYEMLWIFGLGILLGAARLHTGSLWTPIAMHVLCNLGATIETALKAGSV